jgi:hypothetical protein
MGREGDDGVSGPQFLLELAEGVGTPDFHLPRVDAVQAAAWEAQQLPETFTVHGCWAVLATGRDTFDLDQLLIGQFRFPDWELSVACQWQEVTCAHGRSFCRITRQ